MNKRKTSLLSGANVSYMEAMLGKRSSNAAGKHADKRYKRARTRGTRKAQAIKDQTP